MLSVAFFIVMLSVAILGAIETQNIFEIIQNIDMRCQVHFMLSVAILGAIEPKQMAVILPIKTTKDAECCLC
jgi:hypothetical protein